MIIALLMELIGNVLDSMLVFEIPLLPEDVNSYLEYAFSWINAGFGLLANYVPLGSFMGMFGIVIGIDVSISIYNFVMWVLKKIPLANLH